LLAISLAAIAARWAWRELHIPFKAFPEAERVVIVEPGASGAAILRRLAEEGVLHRPWLARSYLTLAGREATLKAGEYRFRGPSSTLEVLEKLLAAEVLLRRVTIVEGLTLTETAQTLAAAGFGQPEAFVALMRSPALVSDLDPEARDLEGYLFPSTYAFARHVSEEDIVSTLVTTFRAQLSQALDEVGVDLSELDLRRTVILASIVEKEALLDSERALVAGVYANRLSRGMGLYADPTVVYALKLEGRWDGNIRRSDLKIESPYNTYVHSGLPPGPICSPGRASLAAAARPDSTSHLYFVSRNDGTHVFADTLAEHNRNVTIWQKQYWRERWRDQRVTDSTDTDDALR
jgi:UPF0755 protein